ncbi:hypothetical protein BC332_11274 [Capsicum chinense]|nr:hypothetical protein BC332_11274 [Capsicum chinense]
MKLGNLNPSGNLLHCMLLSEVKCNKKNLMVFYVKGSYIEFTLDVFGLVTRLSTKSSSSVLSSIREKESGSRLLNTYFDGADKLKMGDLKNFMKTRKGEVQNDLDAVKLAEIYILARVLLWGRLTKKGAVEAFSLEHELPSNSDSEDKRFSLINQKLDKLQSTCSKKFKNILDENKSLKSELSEIKTLLVGKLKANRDILFDKQPDNLQGKSSCDPMVDDQYDDSTKKRSRVTLHLTVLQLDVINHVLFVGVLNIILFTVQRKRKDEQKKERMKKVIQMRKKKPQKKESLVWGPLNMEEIRQAKNQEKNAGAEDLLPFPLVEEFSKFSPYSELQDFGGTKVDEDNIDETKSCGDVDSIINNVIFSVFAASSSLPTSPDVKNTQAERSVGGINNDTTDVISVVDATTKFVNVDSITCVVEISCSFYFVAIFGHNILLHEEKEKYEPNIVVKFTTTDFVFRNKIDALYHDFVKNRKDFSAIPEKHEVEEYIRGFYCDANVPWNKVNFYLEKGIAKSENDTLPIRMVDELPQQTQCDCGVFVCAFADYVIHGRDIPKEINIGHVCMRYGALLWDYEKRKLEADSVLQGYLDICLLPSKISLSRGFVIRSFMLSGTIYYAVLPTGRISSWYVCSQDCLENQ